MKERERTIITALVVLLLVLWLGFLVHRSPRFPGSFVGHLLGISGSTLMLVPLLYLIIKRVKPLKRWVTRAVSLRTLLAWHIYAGILGPILVLLHSGHKFDSLLGTVLTGMTILLVLSGFTGRYLLSQMTRDIREEKRQLTQLEGKYRETAAEIASHAEQAGLIQTFSGFWSRLAAGFFFEAPERGSTPMTAPARAIYLTDSMADIEYAIKTHETFKSWFSIWLKFHITMSFILYTLLSLHIWAAIHFGLRWWA